MTDYQSSHERDDELLSAYLDDELSPEERAAVELRLSQDAAAREMLQQLRGVSQAVQSLPLEVVGHEIAESVLLRVAQDRTAAAAAEFAATADGHRSMNQPTAHDGPMPHLSIGRTKRGWVWASLAVAAALLVMVLQSDRDPDANVPDVARRTERAVPQDARLRATERGELELRALSEQAAPPAADDVPERDAAGPAEAANAPMLERAAALAEERADSLRAPRAAAPPESSNRTTRGLAANSRTSAVAVRPTPNAAPTEAAGAAVDSLAERRAAAPTRGIAAEARHETATESLAQEEPPVVVRVLARREALRTKAFDRLLESQGIQMEADKEAKASTLPVAGAVDNDKAEPTEATSEDAVERAPQQSPASGREVELVLVDAPATVITSSLESLSRDEVNYLGVAVDQAAGTGADSRFDAGAVVDHSPAQQQAVAKQPGVQPGWTKYNRGIVPQGIDPISRDTLQYYQGEQASDRFNMQRRYAGGYGGPGDLEQVRLRDSSLDRPGVRDQRVGNARRLRLWSLAGNQEAEQLGRGRIASPGQSAATAQKLVELSRELNRQAPAADDRVQVLFVISPADEPASSPPARNKAQ